MTKNVSIIVATAANRVIGRENKIPWHLPADMKRFKNLTIGHNVIMGRKTFESILQKLGHPLLGRRNFVLTRNTCHIKTNDPNIIIVSSIQKIINEVLDHPNDKYFVIGGAEIYKELLPYTFCIYLTRIHGKFKGDTLFPIKNSDFDRLFKEKHGSKHCPPNNEHSYGYSFLEYERR